MMNFFTYLLQNEGGKVSSSQYLQTIQAGTEAVEGSNAVFKTSGYTISSS